MSIPTVDTERPDLEHPLLDELRWRDLLYQATDGVAGALKGGTVSAYVGFDPTASSLHVGNLVPVMALVHLQRYGHRPVILVGGGTGLIGDPSGKATERTLQTPETVEANARAIGEQLARFLDFDGPQAARMVNNADWLLGLGAIEFMRDVGKHFTINYMMQKESVKARLDGGISYTEFSYMLLQAYDFLELFRLHGVTLQMGGSDQWGNITAGIELIRRVEGGQAHALTFPLVTTAAGTKFGKTEAGAVWLDPARTSPYQFYQFWVNTDDRDAMRLVRYFTLLDRGTVEALDAATAEHPERREAQRALAEDMTRRVHGEAALTAVREATALLFGQKDVAASPSRHAFEVLSREIPYFEIAHGEPKTRDIVDAVSGPGRLFGSKGEARRAIQQGGLYFNGERVGDDFDAAVNTANGYVLVRKGARNYALVRVDRAA